MASGVKRHGLRTLESFWSPHQSGALTVLQKPLPNDLARSRHGSGNIQQPPSIVLSCIDAENIMDQTFLGCFDISAEIQSKAGVKLATKRSHIVLKSVAGGAGKMGHVRQTSASTQSFRIQAANNSDHALPTMCLVFEGAGGEPFFMTVAGITNLFKKFISQGKFTIESGDVWALCNATGRDSLNSLLQFLEASRAGQCPGVPGKCSSCLQNETQQKLLENERKRKREEQEVGAQREMELKRQKKIEANFAMLKEMAEKEKAAIKEKLRKEEEHMTREASKRTNELRKVVEKMQKEEEKGKAALKKIQEKIEESQLHSVKLQEEWKQWETKKKEAKKVVESMTAESKLLVKSVNKLKGEANALGNDIEAQQKAGMELVKELGKKRKELEEIQEETKKLQELKTRLSEEHRREDKHWEERRKEENRREAAWMAREQEWHLKAKLWEAHEEKHQGRMYETKGTTRTDGSNEKFPGVQTNESQKSDQSFEGKSPENAPEDLHPENQNVDDAPKTEEEKCAAKNKIPSRTKVEKMQEANIAFEQSRKRVLEEAEWQRKLAEELERRQSAAQQKKNEKNEKRRAEAARQRAERERMKFEKARQHAEQEAKKREEERLQQQEAQARYKYAAQEAEKLRQQKMQQDKDERRAQTEDSAKFLAIRKNCIPMWAKAVARSYQRTYQQYEDLWTQLKASQDEDGLPPLGILDIPWPPARNPFFTMGDSDPMAKKKRMKAALKWHSDKFSLVHKKRGLVESEKAFILEKAGELARLVVHPDDAIAKMWGLS